MLLIGYGNPGRGDDGLGPAFAQRIADRALPGLTVETGYQLTVEHALPISRADIVVFADAAADAEGAYYFRGLDENAAEDLGSHSVTPEAALKLARLLFGASPRGFVLGIAGADFGEMADGLSRTAEHNLGLAEACFLDWIAAGSAAHQRD